MRRIAAAVCLIVLPLGCGLIKPIAAQEPADTAAAGEDGEGSLGWIAMGIGLTDFMGDVNAPGSLTEIGLDWKPFSFLGLGVGVGSGAIEETATCERNGLNFQCNKTESIYSASFEGRIYAYENPMFLTFGVGQVGIQSDGLGRFRDLGVGVLFKTVGKLAVGIELRRRFGWPDPLGGGSIYVFKVARRWGAGDDSAGGTR